MRSASACAEAASGGRGQTHRGGRGRPCPGIPGILLACALALAGQARAESGHLHEAAERGDLATLTRLLAAGAEPDAMDERGVTPLHLAAAAGHVDVVRALLDAGAHVDQMEFDGDTPLVNASALGRTGVVQLLLERGADWRIESSQGFTPIQLARRGRHGPSVRLLRDAAKAGKLASRPPPGPPRSSGATPPRSSGNAPAPLRAEASARRYRPGYARRIAAVIGVNAYEHWPPLVGARPDAEKVAARLRGLGFDQVFELYDRDATRPAILDLLGRRLAEATGENDLVVVFFAGHGQTETVEGGRKRGYVVPVDATLDGVFSTGIAMRKLRELTSRLPAKHVYYAMDSCYSGLGFTRGVSVVRPGASDYFGKVTSLRAVQMVTAGGEGEEAIERDGEGVFTRSFLDALEGAADANGDGYVTATEIGAYVAPRVTNETGARQSPQAGRLEGEGEIAFEIHSRR